MMDAAKRRIYPAIVTMLLLVIAAMAYEFADTGSTQKIEDGLVTHGFTTDLQMVLARTLQQNWPNEHSIEKK